MDAAGCSEGEVGGGDGIGVHDSVEDQVHGTDAITEDAAGGLRQHNQWGWAGRKEDGTVLAPVVALSAGSGELAGKGVSAGIDGNAATTATAAFEEFTRTAIGGDAPVASERAGIDPNAAARAAAGVILKAGVAVGAELTIDSESAGYTETQRAAAL